MVKRATSVLAAALLSSCAVLPKYSETTAVSIRAVVDAVQCEIKRGTDLVRVQVPDLPGWGVAYDLELKIDNKNNIALAAFDWTIPTAVTTSTLSLAPTAKREVTSTRSGKLSFSQEIKDLGCPPPVGAEDQIFHGNLGVADWLGRAADSDALYRDQLSQINYTAQFVIVMGADLKPGFKIINLTGAATAGTSQTKTNTLTLTIKKPDKKPPPGGKAKSTARQDAEKAQAIYQLQSIISDQ